MVSTLIGDCPARRMLQDTSACKHTQGAWPFAIFSLRSCKGGQVEAEEWYDSADVLVVPSWYEPFGMVTLEGMLHGLPIVASAIGGPAEILEHERTGLLFPPGNVEALADALLQFLTNPSLCQRVGTAAADEVRHSWQWSHIMTKMQVVYQEAMSSR